MAKKIKTMQVSGNEYAKVKDRVKEFREENPHGLIETTPTIGDGHIIFKARVLKDKGDEASAEATGHSMGKGDGQKVFEKQESIAVGRALALLGYGADGEIASAEEMEEFEEYKQQQFMEVVEEASENIDACKSTDELKDVWVNLSGELKTALIELKERKKIQLNEKNTDGAEQPEVAGLEKGEDNGKPSKKSDSKKG